MQFMNVCKLQNKAEDYSTEEPKCLVTLQICEQQLISFLFFFAANMKEIKDDKSNYTLNNGLLSVSGNTSSH